MNPGKRLLAAAAAVRENRLIVDVGTDHAYLPAYLILSGKTTHCLAVDIGVGPLKNAEKTVEKYGLSDSVMLRISDGLQAVFPSEAEDITICGMGGTLMTAILKNCSWLQKDDLHLVLQPQSHVWEVRAFLMRNGFCITQESVLEENDKLYITIEALYDGIDRTVSDGECYFGSLLHDTHPLAVRYTQERYRQAEIRFNALKNAGMCNAETDFLAACIEYYNNRTD